MREGGCDFPNKPDGFSGGVCGHKYICCEESPRCATEAVPGVIMRRTSKPPEAALREWLGKDTWLTSKEALDAGLVDELVEPPRLLRPSGDVHAQVLAEGPTEDERLLQTLLTGLGTIQVRDKAAFGRELAAWFDRNIHTME